MAKVQSHRKTDRLTLKLLCKLQEAIDLADTLADIRDEEVILFIVHQQAQRLRIIRDHLECAVSMPVLDSFLSMRAGEGQPMPA